MVDFQSRDTRRGSTDEDDETDEAESSDDEPTATDAGPEEADTAASDGTESSPEPTSGDADTASAAGDATENDHSEQTTETDSTSTADTGTEDPLADSSVAGRTDDAASADTESESPSTPGPEAAEQADGPTQDHQSESARPPSQSDQMASGTGGTAEETAPTADTSQEQEVTVAVVTVGTTTEDGDPTGEAVETALEATGQTVTARERLRGDYDTIQGTVDRLVERDDVAAVVTAGGLGVAPTEQTLEAVHPLFEKALPGFEEVYRSLLFEQRGTGVIAVRATAGIANGTPVFCLPAEPAAARLAIDEIIAAEAPALVAALS
ncbi:molybdopterin-binding protein [Haloarcula sp. S1AR25-5A]|uniref:Molybdopterin-binding protein n=1 Tax=Haloarcula terrestris TaxID=2950533 RepID=A0AAE4EXL0_9EURY|nr:molybdopterin-binding protein [Haloarcula terrestris]MDS0222115.1 molybdopterin-binding protein [Haloarcula terrestris]